MAEEESPSGQELAQPATPLTSVLGEHLLVKNNDNLPTPTSTSSCVAGKHVGLLFTRAFVPSCHRFLPKLASSYQSLEARGKAFEVVYVTCESTQERFDEYYGEMPWAALPFGSPAIAALTARFIDSKSVLPVLVMLDPDGKVLNKNAKKDVLDRPHEFPWVQAYVPVTSTIVSKITPVAIYLVPLSMCLYMYFNLYSGEYILAGRQAIWDWIQLLLRRLGLMSPPGSDEL